MQPEANAACVANALAFAVRSSLNSHVGLDFVFDFDHLCRKDFGEILYHIGMLDGPHSAGSNMGSELAGGVGAAAFDVDAEVFSIRLGHTSINLPKHDSSIP